VCYRTVYGTLRCVAVCAAEYRLTGFTGACYVLCAAITLLFGALQISLLNLCEECACRCVLSGVCFKKCAATRMHFQKCAARSMFTRMCCQDCDCNAAL